MNNYSNYIYSALIKLVSFLYFFLLIKISASYLEAEEFGIFFLVYNGGLYIACIFLGQQSAGLLRFYHEMKEKIVLYYVIGRQVFVAVIVCIGAAFIIWLLPDVEWGIHVILMSSFGLIFGLFGLISSLFRAQGRFRSLLFLVLFQSIAAIGILMLLADQLNWKLVIGSVISSFVLVQILYLGKVSRSLFRIFGEEKDPELSGKLVKYGAPIVLVALFNQLLSSSDQFVLKYYNYTDELGVYAANYSIAEKAIFTFLSVVTFVFVPNLFKTFTGDPNVVFWKISKIVGVFLLFSTTVLLLFYFFSFRLSLLLTSPELALGHKLIPLAAIGCMFLGVASFYSEMLTISKKTKRLAFAFFGAVLLNLILNFSFVKDGGIYLAVYTSIFSYFFLMILILIMAYAETLRKSV